MQKHQKKQIINIKVLNLIRRAKDAGDAAEQISRNTEIELSF